MTLIAGEKHNVSIIAHSFAPKVIGELSRSNWKVDVNTSGDRTYFSAKRNNKPFDITRFSDDLDLKGEEKKEGE